MVASNGKRTEKALMDCLERRKEKRGGVGMGKFEVQAKWKPCEEFTWIPTMPKMS